MLRIMVSNASTWIYQLLQAALSCCSSSPLAFPSPLLSSAFFPALQGSAFSIAHPLFNFLKGMSSNKHLPRNNELTISAVSWGCSCWTWMVFYISEHQLCVTTPVRLHWRSLDRFSSCSHHLNLNLCHDMH